MTVQEQDIRTVPTARAAAAHEVATPWILRPDATPRRTLAIAVAGAVVVTVAGLVVTATDADLPFLEWANGFHTGAVAGFSSLVYAVFEPVWSILLTVVLTGLIWAVGKDIRLAAAFAGVVAATWIPAAIVKLVVHRPRPVASLLTHPFSPAQTDPSYPSGHTVFVAALAIALVYVLRETRWERFAVVLGTVFVALVATALIVDAVHFPADVAGSLVWAVCVAPAVRWFWVDVIMARVPFLAPRTPYGPGTSREHTDAV